MLEFKPERRERGSALTYVLIMIVAITAITFTTYGFARSSSQVSVQQISKARLRGYAEAAVAESRLKLWEQYLLWRGAGNSYKAGTAQDYGKWLDGSATSPSVPTKITTDGTWISDQGAGVWHPLLSQTVSAPGAGLGNVVVTAQVNRRDALTSARPSVFVTIAATASSSYDGSYAMVEATFPVRGPQFDGFRFALLTNQVTCTICHVHFDNAARYYNKDGTQNGTFDRVRVASLQTLEFRQNNSLYSELAGTLYTRGGLFSSDTHAAMQGSDLSANGFYPQNFDASGHIVEPMVKGAFTNNTNSTLANQSYYGNYSTNAANEGDGSVPNSFPAVIPDMNGDRIVNDVEFQSTKTASTGSITGGVMVQVANGGTYTGVTGQTSANINLPTGTTTGATSANITGGSGPDKTNVVLVGTAANPIVINGQVAIDGDVIISGVVQGTGMVVARNNLYILSDLTYKDGTSGGNRTFGKDPSGNTNAVAFAAGGNVLMGDYLSATDRNGNWGNPNPSVLYSKKSSADSFTEAEIGMFNRNEWLKTQATIGGNPNPQYDASYVPRYYQFNPADPIYIANKNSSYNTATGTWNGNEWDNFSGQNKLTPPTSGPGSVYATLPLNPTGAWINESDFYNMVRAVEATRAAAKPPGTPVEIDGLVYTNNAIFSIARQTDSGQGRMIVNGSLIAADTGLLGGGKYYSNPSYNTLGEVGLQLNYDANTRKYINIADPTQVVMQAGTYYER